MRAALALALATGALAVPFVKRDNVVVTDIEVDYVTAIVTVTQGAAPATTESSSAASSSSSAKHFGHHWHPSSSVISWATTWTSTSAASSSTKAPASSSSEAPAPTSAAPSPSSTYAAPSSYSMSSSSAASSQTASPTSYQGLTVYHHNVHRSNHSALDLDWDDALAATAAKIAASCVYAHDTSTDGGGYGQNIAAGVEPSKIGAVISDLFYNGEVGWYDGLYGQDQPDMTNFEHWGHFSQVVWKDTTHVGCATQDCSAKGLANVGSGVSPYFTVCNYKGPGNYANEYGDNVGSSLNRATVSGDAS